MLQVSYAVGALVDAAAAIGMTFPTRFGAAARYVAPFDFRRPELRYGMRYGAPLMAGWTVLLIWAMFDPLARRDILLITIVPVIAGLMANDIAAVRRGELRRGPALAIRSLQIVLIVLFGTSYALSLA